MEIDKKVLSLLGLPVVAGLMCFMVYMVIPTQTDFTPDKPEFLTYVDQLNLYSQNLQGSDTHVPIRDVFHRNGRKDNPIIVSMIIKNGSGSYCIVNGEKMRIGDKTNAFQLVSINKNSITVAYNNGAEETVHVNIY